METRVQHDGEARHHGHPANFRDCCTELPRAGGDAIFQDETDCMESHSPCGDENAPEVEASIATENVEDPDGEFDRHPERNGSEDGNQGPGIALVRFRRSVKDDLPDSLVPRERASAVERPVKVSESNIGDGDIVDSVHSRHDEFSFEELIVKY